MRIIGNTDIGLVRKENQDALWVNQMSDDTAIAVVCDGMGGVSGGKQASKLALDAVREYFQEHSGCNDVKSMFESIIEKSNHAVHRVSREAPELAGMGTTMVLALVQGQRVSFANVGDSRGYHITNGGITQITKDHSAVQELVDAGHLTERQAKIHPNKNIITRAIGIEDAVQFDYFEIAVLPGDLIVLCSDGLTNHVDESEIQFEASGGEFEDLPKRLIDLANSRGGNDNITVAAIQI